MSNFFQQAPVKDSFQKKVLASIFHKQTVVGSFPLGYPMASLYHLPAVMGEGLAVVISPNSLFIRRNLDYLAYSGLHYPEVAVLDGSQVPHQEREILQHLNRHRVRLLYTTPEKFASLSFLQILAHNALGFLAIEQAQFLLEGFSGSVRYQKVWEGLNTLQRYPPLVLLTPPLPAHRLVQLAKKFSLSESQFFHQDPVLEKTCIQVNRFFTEHQKFRRLTHLLSGMPEPGLMGKIHEPGSVLIYTADSKSGEKLVDSLSQFGFDPVFAYHSKISREERLRIEQAFHSEAHAIVVTSGYEGMFLQPPVSKPFRIIHWHPPASLEEYFSEIFRAQQKESGAIDSLFLYTREDYQQIISRIKWDESKRYVSGKSRIESLKKVRQWILTEKCRYQSLTAFWKGDIKHEISPCGHCDRCQSKPFGGGIRAILKHWLY